jgi:hypothetical protein
MGSCGMWGAGAWLMYPTSPGPKELTVLSIVSILPIPGRAGQTGVVACRLGVDAEMGRDRPLPRELGLTRPLGLLFA